MTNTKDWALVVLSCDAYHDLWPHFAYFFDKYWPDCPFNSYLVTNELDYKHPRLKIINTGAYQDWSTTTSRACKKIPEPYLFVLLEDFLLNKKVPTQKLSSLMQKLIARDLNYCLMRPEPKLATYDRDGIGVFPKGMPYRIGTIDLWRKSYLQKLLINGESPWNFEIMGSYRASYSEGIFSYNQQLVSSVNGVGKGQWFPEAVQFCQSHGLTVDLNFRPQKNYQQNWLYGLQNFVFRTVSAIPWQKRVSLMNKLRKLLISY